MRALAFLFLLERRRLWRGLHLGLGHGWLDGQEHAQRDAARGQVRSVLRWGEAGEEEENGETGGEEEQGYREEEEWGDRRRRRMGRGQEGKMEKREEEKKRK